MAGPFWLTLTDLANSKTEICVDLQLKLRSFWQEGVLVVACEHLWNDRAGFAVRDNKARALLNLLGRTLPTVAIGQVGFRREGTQLIPDDKPSEAGDDTGRAG